MPTLDLTPAQLDLRLYVGDDPVVELRVWTDAAKTEGFDFTNYTGWASVVRAPSGSTAAFTIDTTDVATGVLRLRLEGDDVRTFPRTGCRWDVQCVDPDGRDLTLLTGRVVLRDDQTQ